MPFQPVSGRGTILQYVIVHQTKLTGFEGRVPYGAAAVELDEQKGLVVVGNVLGHSPDHVNVGDRVRVTFQRIHAELALPQFCLDNDDDSECRQR
jgi:uncharacterized OB-fold protein